MLRNNEKSPQRAILCGFSRLGSVARARFPTVCGKKERTITRSVVIGENLYLSAKDLSRKAFPSGNGENFMKKKTAFPFGSAENIFFQTLTACNLTLLRETPL